MMPIEPNRRARGVRGSAPVWRGAARVTAVIAFIAAPATASAFQIETSSTSACHESITLEALEAAGWPDGREPPPLDDTGQRIADDLPFDLPGDRKDLWSIALVIGVRHNDVGSNDPFDLPALSQLHGDPARQPEHCLRQGPHDGASGDQQAIDACAAFVIEQIEQALAGSDGEVDMDATVEIETHLLFRGKVELDLPAYPFHVGRALHALQDSYTHQFRNPADERVRSVLNWVEGNLEGDSDEMRDGHPHLTTMDECGSNLGDARRRDWAVQASADLLAALASDKGGRGGRIDRARAVFAAHTEIEPGCSAANDYCDTRESTVATGCSTAGSAQLGGPGWLLAALALLALGRAAVQRASGRRRVAALVVAVALLTPVAAGAQEEGSDDQSEAEQAREAEETGDEQADESLAREERVLERLPDPVSETWGASFNVAAAFDRGAGAASLGLRWNPWRDLGFGLDAEYNPWVSVSGFEVAPGAASLYVPVIWRLKRFGTWELRATAYAGATTILFDLVGVDKGAVGLFAGINPLGLALPLGGHTKLVVKPGDIVVSAPQLRGIPFYYHQYRLTVGIEWYP
jgi:hypothetical protein